MSKYLDIYNSQGICPTNMEKKSLDAATKTVLDALNTASKKVFHKAAEATGEFIRIKIADKTVKPKPIIDQNHENFEEVVHLRKGKKN